MMNGNTNFASAIEALRAERGDSVELGEISEVVDSLLQTLTGDVSADDLKVYRELETLAAYISKAREEIAAIQPREIQAEHIPSATDELDAIVAATEEATGTILDAAEALEGLAEKADEETGREIGEIVTRVYEACNFQDITGQRITKVVKTLQHIEVELDKIVGLFGDGDADEEPKAKKPDDGAKTDKSLLNGPQLSENAATQEEIDALLASFD